MTPIVDRSAWHREILFMSAAGVLLLAAVATFTQPAATDRALTRPELVTEVSGRGGEYLLGAGVGFGPHRMMAHGSVLGFDPVGFNVGVGYGNDAVRAAGLYRQHSPGRLPYLAASDRTGGLLLLEYTPSDMGPRRTLANELYVGQVTLRHSGSRLALYDKATISLDLLADYRSRISLVADLDTLQLLHLPAGAYALGLAAPMTVLGPNLHRRAAPAAQRPDPRESRTRPRPDRLPIR